MKRLTLTPAERREERMVERLHRERSRMPDPFPHKQDVELTPGQLHVLGYDPDGTPRIPMDLVDFYRARRAAR